MNLLLFAVFNGMMAFAHSIGAIIAVINIAAITLFYSDFSLKRVKGILFASLVTFIFGWIHYFIDIFWGTG